MFNFRLLKQSQWLDLMDAGKINALFALLDGQPNTNDVFVDGVYQGYEDFYNATRSRPAPFTAQNFYLFLKSVFMSAPLDAKDATFLDSWELGYVAGWCVALGEMNLDSFFVGHGEHNNKSQWTRLRDESQGVDVICREEYRAQGTIQYVLNDDEGHYIATVSSAGISCSCGQPGCKHTPVVARISPWFHDEKIVSQAPAKVEV